MITPNKTIERRAAAEFTLSGSGRRLGGYAAVFHSEARIADFRELIRPGAFTESLRTRQDILALVDHDTSRVLARTKSGTLELSEDAKGLRFELSLPATQAGRDVLALAERGDLGGASFGFLVREGGEQWNGNTRELTAVDLMEISIVSAWPAYPDTTVAARSRPSARLAMARRYLETLR